MQKNRNRKGSCFLGEKSLSVLHHSAHAWVAHRHFGLLFGLVADDTFRGEEHAGNAGSVLECNARYFCGIYHTCCAEVFVLLRLCVIAVVALAFTHVVHDNGTFYAPSPLTEPGEYTISSEVMKRTEQSLVLELEMFDNMRSYLKSTLTVSTVQEKQ